MAYEEYEFFVFGEAGKLSFIVIENEVCGISFDDESAVFNVRYLHFFAPYSM